MTYFIKEVLSNPIRLPNGTKINWIDVGGDVGVLETNSADLISELKNAEARHVGGVYEIEKDKYDDLIKKKGVGSQRRESLLQVVRQFSLKQSTQEKDLVGNVAEVEVGQPLEVPIEIPRTRKGGRPRKTEVKAE